MNYWPATNACYGSDQLSVSTELERNDFTGLSHGLDTHTPANIALPRDTPLPAPYMSSMASFEGVKLELDWGDGRSSSVSPLLFCTFPVARPLRRDLPDTGGY